MTGALTEAESLAHIARVRAHAQALRRAAHERDVAICAAVRAGVPVERVATTAVLPVARVDQIARAGKAIQ